MSDQAQQQQSGQSQTGGMTAPVAAFQRLAAHTSGGGGAPAGAQAAPHFDPATLLGDIQAVLGVVTQVVATIARNFPHQGQAQGPQP